MSTTSDVSNLCPKDMSNKMSPTLNVYKSDQNYMSSRRFWKQQNDNKKQNEDVCKCKSCR